MWHEIKFLLGLTDPGGWPYLAWSGFLGRVVLPTAFIGAWWRHHNCHEPRCHRLGHPSRDGRIVCRKHLVS